MGTTADKIGGILSQAESDLRRIIAEAAGEGDYRGVDMARQVAVSIQEIRDTVTERTSEGSPVMSSDAPSDKPKRKRTVSAGKSSRALYPRFAVNGDVLTKIGWSKRQKKEYTHRAPRTVFDRTVQAMVSLANGQAGPFTAEQIIDRVNKSEDEFVPSYQIYIVIALLRKNHCIRQQGRDGYVIPPDISTKAKEAWSGTHKDT